MTVDPLHYSDGTRRKTFYPFSSHKNNIDVTVKIDIQKISNLTEPDVDIDFCCTGKDEELAVWQELFNVENRYKAHCCSNRGGKHWLQRVFEDGENYNQTPSQMLNAEIKSAKNAPWFETNFLKASFLEGCQRAGILGT